MTYVTLFELSTVPATLSWAPFVGAGAGAAGVIFMLLRRFRDRLTIGRHISICVAVALLVTITSHSCMAQERRLSAQRLANASVEIVEGPVQDFHPMPYEGHASERFRVGKEHFEYSDFMVTGAFNNTASHGGPIREGLRVRIGFVRRGEENLIVKLERADAQQAVQRDGPASGGSTR